MSDQSDNPTVSVIVPCYNSEKTIERCILSVLAQTMLPMEILIYDDCSTDGTLAIISELAQKHPKIVISKGEENRGAGFARTTLLRQAKGAFFAFLDADDVWDTQKLEKQMQLLLNEQADICVCGYEIFSGSEEKIGSRQPPQKINYTRMHLANWIPTSMAVVRADLQSTRGMPMIRRRQDYAYWLTIFRTNPQAKCVTLEGKYGSYFRNDGSLSSNWKKNLSANYAMFRKTLGYAAPVAALCVFANVVTRVLRA